MSPEVRFYDNEDARRDLAVEMLKGHVRSRCAGVNYDADIEFMEYAILAFADECAARDLAPPKGPRA